MKVRVITAVIGIAILFPFFWLSDPMGVASPLSYIFPVALSALTLVAVWELLHCIGLHRNYFVSVPLYLAAIAFPVLARVMGELEADFAQLSVIVTLALAVYLLAVIVFQFGKTEMGKVALSFLVSIYVIGSFSAIVVLRDVPVAGRFLFLIPFVFSWVTDTFAYFCGRLFGKHKLIPAVSPKKTVEGAIGGAVFCALTAFVYGLVVNACFDVVPNYPVLILSGLLISVVSQIGDLAMSAIKRQYDLKDFGKILPGHGGILDRFDSSIAVTVVVLTVNTYLPFFQVG